MAPSRRWVPSSIGAPAVPPISQSGFSSSFHPPPRPCNLPSSFFRTLNFILRGYRSGSSVNTHPKVGRIPAGAAACRRSAAFRKLTSRLANLARSTATSRTFRWQIVANDKEKHTCAAEDRRENNGTAVPHCGASRKNEVRHQCICVRVKLKYVFSLN